MHRNPRWPQWGADDCICATMRQTVGKRWSGGRPQEQDRPPQMGRKALEFLAKSGSGIKVLSRYRFSVLPQRNCGTQRPRSRGAGAHGAGAAGRPEFAATMSGNSISLGWRTACPGIRRDRRGRGGDPTRKENITRKLKNKDP